MFTRLRLSRFKNFEEAELSMGSFTLLVGANASGKSNVREALRFLHAVGRGYTLAEIFGGKWSAGERQWDGIAGGVREAAFRGAESFGVEIETEGKSQNLKDFSDTLIHRLRLEVATRPDDSLFPRMLAESLVVGIAHVREPAYDSRSAEQKHSDQLVVRLPQLVGSEWATMDHAFGADRPVLSQVLKRDDPRLGQVDIVVRDMLTNLSTMRFVDPDPKAMRQPSAPGQTVLSDRGENLSSVLQSLCEDEKTKAELIRWIRLLTPMDVADLKFASDLRGEVLLLLVESDGTALSAYSASEGTLRFLALLAALLSAEPGLYFFEEIENGLHPSRLRLVLDLIRSRTASRKIQVVATTHSPMLLSLLDEQQLEHASLVYRLEGERTGRIQRLLDVPDARRVLATHDRADLLASGWFEDMVELASAPREPLVKRPTPGAAA